MKSFLLAVIILAGCGTGIFADFEQDENPVTGLNIDTAYTLKDKKTLVRAGIPDFTLPVSFGVFENLTIGTRGVIWLTPVSVPNIYGKWNIVTETADMPAFSFGGEAGGADVRNFEVKDSDGNVTDAIDRVEFFYYNLTGYISKRIGELVFVSASFSYNKMNVTLTDSDTNWDELNSSFMDTLKYYTGKEDPLGITNAAVSVIWQVLPCLRIISEGLFLAEEPFAWYLGGGIKWAIGDVVRVSAGAAGIFNIAGSNYGVPHIEFDVRF